MASAEPKEDLVQDVQFQSNAFNEVAVDQVRETDPFLASNNRGSRVYDKN